MNRQHTRIIDTKEFVTLLNNNKHVQQRTKKHATVSKQDPKPKYLALKLRCL